MSESSPRPGPADDRPGNPGNPGDTRRFGSDQWGYTGTGTQTTYPRQDQYGGQPNPYRYYGAPPEPPRQRSKPSSGFTAGIVVAALIVGGLGGLAGAAGFTALDQLSGNCTGSPSTTADRSTVSDRQDSAPAPGSVEQVAKSVLPSVVKINVQGPQGAASGSGIIVSSDGEILTNNHVVEVAAGGGAISVNFNSGSAAKAQVVGTDPLTDLAVIKAQGVGGLTPAKLGRSAHLDVGEQVIAVGSPFGLQATVTDGIVSALNRPVSVGGTSAEGGTDTTYPAIQTDAAINPGNSGGPLVNMHGEVVGINSSIRTASNGLGGEGGSIGLGFAIPLDNVMPIVDQLRSGETPTHARLGVTVTDVSRNDGMLTGAGVTSVSAGSAADKAGLRRGDVITRVDKEPMSGSEALVATIRGHRPGDTVTLTVQRNDQIQQTKVTLDSDGGTPTS